MQLLCFKEGPKLHKRVKMENYNEWLDATHLQTIPFAKIDKKILLRKSIHTHFMFSSLAEYDPSLKTSNNNSKIRNIKLTSCTSPTWRVCERAIMSILL